MKKERERDAGLRRVSRTTSWVTAGALVSAGGLSIAVAEAFPGHSGAAGSVQFQAGPTPQTPARQAPTRPSTSSGGSGLQSPASAAHLASPATAPATSPRLATPATAPTTARRATSPAPTPTTPPTVAPTSPPTVPQTLAPPAPPSFNNPPVITSGGS